MLKIAPSLALKCLEAVPIDKEAATSFIDWYKPYLQFQSNIAWLKDPPSSYKKPGVDLLRGLDGIKAKVKKGHFNNQYDFELAINTLLQQSHDGHLGIYLPASTFFEYRYPYEFISFSVDGKQLPQVFVKGELLALFMFYC